MKQGTKRFDLGVMPLYVQAGRVMVIDQRKLPQKEEFFDATELDDMCYAIREMVVRGAPAIGVAAAFGLVCEAKRIATQKLMQSEFLEKLSQAKNKLQATRPTAINLHWATEKIYSLAQMRVSNSKNTDYEIVASSLFENAENMLNEHIKTNKAIGDFGASLIGQKSSVLTHCNAGSLATCGWGTALGVIRSAFLNDHKNVSVIVGETRPRSQGARLTMWELRQDGIPATLVTDSMAGHMMATGKVDLIIVGADRIAANGDTANKIGTYNLAVLAKYHNLPFYVAAPLSTFDLSITNGKQIPIEERDSSEVTAICSCGEAYTVLDAQVFNPAFDVTSADLITGIITQVGILRAPYKQSIQQAFDNLASGGFELEKRSNHAY